MNLRSFAIAGVVILAMLAAYAAMGQGAGFPGAKKAAAPANITYSQLVTQTKQGKVKSALVKGDQVKGEYQDGKTFTAVTPYPNEALVDQMLSAGVDVKAETTRQPWFLVVPS